MTTSSRGTAASATKAGAPGQQAEREGKEVDAGGSGLDGAEAAGPVTRAEVQMRRRLAEMHDMSAALDRQIYRM